MSPGNRQILLVGIGFGGLLLVAAGVLWLVYSTGITALPLHVPHPIILLHGLGGNADVWDDAGFGDYLEQAGLTRGGVVRAWDGEVASFEGGDPEAGDFFILDVSDSFQGIDGWVPEIEAAVEAVLKATDAPRVVLLGFSTGGVAARQYLIEHSADHGVARLVTVSSPHGGSELADLALKLRGFLESGEGRQPGTLRDSAATALEEVSGIPLDASLLDDLVTPKDGNYLFRLGQAPHPMDVDYACVVTTGSPLPMDWKGFQAQIAALRSGGSNVFLNRLATPLMGLLSTDGQEAGDGTVLASKQNLGGIPFFLDHPELLEEVHLLDKGHLDAKSAYPVLVTALAGDLELAPSGIERTGEGDRMLLDLEHTFAGLAEVSAVDPAGHLLPVSPLRIQQDGQRIFARLAVGPLAEPPPPGVELEIRARGQARPWRYPVILDGNGSSPSSVNQAGPVPYTVSLLKIWGLGQKDWDTIGKHPDPLAVFFRGDKEVWRGEQVDDARGLVQLAEHVQLELDPRRERLRLALWDLDIGEVPESMGEVVFNPGELPNGHFVVVTDERVAMELEVRRGHEDGVVWKEPLLLGE